LNAKRYCKRESRLDLRSVKIYPVLFDAFMVPRLSKHDGNFGFRSALGVSGQPWEGHVFSATKAGHKAPVDILGSTCICRPCHDW
jgi:hypothetical protein